MTATTQDIVPVDIQDEMQNCYLDYAMSVIVGRALPDVRDGLKPGARRSLFAMDTLSNYHNRPYTKSARVVGDVIGKYHPHGDSAVYMTIVRMAQEFSLRYPLIQGQGNFGSIDGDSPAAMRYTEVRMQKLCEELLKDLDKETVDWRPNYDDRLKEPVVLPTKIPNLLVNGSSGIAVGMATNIPPHNLNEVISGLTALIDNPDLTIDQLMEHIPGPDFPTAGLIYGSKGIKQAYHTGRGIIKLRAKAETVVNGSKQSIVVTELPYQVNKAALIEKIAELDAEKLVEGIARVRDLSNSRGKANIKIQIDLKKGETAEVVLNQLYKHTQMQTSFGINLLAVCNGQPKTLNLKEILKHFLDHRREVVIRRTLYQLRKAKERAHLLEGLKTAVENIEEVVELVKTSESPAAAKAALVSRFSLSEVQAQAILDLKLQRLTGLEQEKILADYEEVLALIEELNTLLGSEDLIRETIKTEFQEIVTEFGDERRSQIVARSQKLSVEDLTEKEDVIVTVTHRGYLKRMPIDTYKTQKRGGTGVKGNNGDDDFYTDIFTANTHDVLLFFTSTGKMFSRKVHEIPKGTRTSKGKNIVNLLPISTDEKIRAILVQPQEIEDKYIVFVTRGGLIKKSDLSDYQKVRQSGMKAIKLVEGDTIVNVAISEKGNDILIAASSGKFIRFSQDDVKPKSRVSQGSRGIALFENEQVVGMEVITGDGQVLAITERGYGKRTDIEQYRCQARGGKGALGIRLTLKNGPLAAIKFVQATDDLMVITDAGQVIKTQMKDITSLGRTTQGVRIIHLKSDEKVVAVENISEEDD